jgi:hypothetical protein
MSSRPVIRRKGEQGFALLLVFVMAAAIALMLYKQVPRVAFESERDKEQLLIDRGGQYQRAIQVYYATFKRYPARIEDLENTNDKRFLRRRYVDPFTGKDEWRIIHTNGLFLTDSKVQKPPATPGTDGSNQLAGVGSPAGGTAPGGIASGGIGGPGTSTNASSNATGTNATPGANGSSDPNAPPPVNAMVAARPSDRTLPGNQSYSNPTAPGITSQNGFPNTQNPPNYNDPASFPPISLFPNGYNAPQQGQQGNGQQNTGNQPGLNQQGLNQQGLNQLGLNQPGLNQPGLNQPGLNQPGLNGVNPLNLNPQGLPIGFPQPNSGQPNTGVTGGIIGAPGLPNGVQQGSIQQGSIQQGLAQQGLIPQPGQQFQNQPQQQFPGQPIQGQPGMPVQLPGQPPPGQIPQGGAPGAPGANAGLNLIQQLLTTPRAPPPGIGPGTTDNQTTGAAIAGVASKFSGPTIKSFGGRTDYSEWEFVFQPQQQQVMPQMGQQQQNGQQQNGQQQTGTQQPGIGNPGIGGPGGLPAPTNH